MMPVGSMKALLVLFVAWKCILFAAAALSPGSGYDTSALILFNPGLGRHVEFRKWGLSDRLALNLLSWDALYFVKAAQSSKIYEQEWAFSWAYSEVLRKITRLISQNQEPSLKSYIWTAVVISTIMHLSAVVTLFKLLNVVTGKAGGSLASFVACVLHVVSPAGLFLISPYAESAFACMNFLGMLSYAHARPWVRPRQTQTWREDVLLLSSGLCFGLATMLRSNGLLSGLIFLFDVAMNAPSALMLRLSKNELRRVVFTCAAGSLVAVGFVLPQYLAYQEYCNPSSEPTRVVAAWCQQTIPSIYSWVQSKYWNVGLFRYWTLSNLPLFLLAFPMLWLLLRSSVEHWHCLKYDPSAISSHQTYADDTAPKDAVHDRLPQLVLPQFVLAVTAVMSFHVQIINRISSGYPIWYLTVANWFIQSEGNSGVKVSSRLVQVIVRGMIMYAIIQGALYASFLPPA